MELNAVSTDANGDVTASSRKRREPPDECPQVVKRVNTGLAGAVVMKSLTSSPGRTMQAAQSPSALVQPATPTKTITISQSGIVTPPRSIAFGTPIKHAALLGSPLGSRTPTKIAMIPAKSPTPIAPAVGSFVAAPGMQTITLSPSRVIIKNLGGVSAAVKSLTSANSFQHVQVTGIMSQGKFVATTTTSQMQPCLTVKGTTSKPLTFAGGRFVQAVHTLGPTQRIILPANGGTVVTAMQQQTGSGCSTPQAQAFSIITSSSNATSCGTVSGGSGSGQVVAVLSADVIARLQQINHTTSSQTSTSIIATPSTTLSVKKMESFIPIASNDPAISSSSLAAASRTHYVSNSVIGNGSGSGAGTGGASGAISTEQTSGARPRKPCNCTKSQCLKLYCDCFANGEFCHGCNCTNCANNLEHEEERQRAIKSCLDRNPQAFHPKIGLLPLTAGKGGMTDVTRRHQKGCNCKRSGCLKNYCECYEAKIMCGNMCKCVGCKNFEESPERKTLMHLADAAEVRVLQQTAAKNKLSSQFRDMESRAYTAATDRLAYSYVTQDVVEAICNCLLAQCQEAEQAKCKKAQVERLVIEEFGRSLLQIIQAANSRPKE